MPAVQEDLARTASPPVPAAEGQKTDLPSKEVEQAKPNAAGSEATAQRKLADAEAALKTAKEEAKQARAEAERAKADAQAARSSEVAAKRKLTDAEAARAETENACRNRVFACVIGLDGLVPKIIECADQRSKAFKPPKMPKQSGREPRVPGWADQARSGRVEGSDLGARPGAQCRKI